jgi:hypothetical protein
MNAAAPEGTPPRRISVYKHICKHRTAPPCLGEALRRGALIELEGLMIFMVWVRTIPFSPFQRARFPENFEDSMKLELVHIQQSVFELGIDRQVFTIDRK